MSKKSKKVVISKNPYSGKTARAEQNPVNYDTTRFKWLISPIYIDYDHDIYGWDRIPVQYLLGTIVTRFHTLEGQTWAEIKLADNHNHSKPIVELEGELQSRLKERDLDHLENLFQISVGNVPRIFGYREKQIFYPMWWDETHSICPTNP